MVDFYLYDLLFLLSKEKEKFTFQRKLMFLRIFVWYNSRSFFLSFHTVFLFIRSFSFFPSFTLPFFGVYLFVLFIFFLCVKKISLFTDFPLSLTPLDFLPYLSSFSISHSLLRRWTFLFRSSFFSIFFPSNAVIYFVLYPSFVLVFLFWWSFLVS